MIKVINIITDTNIGGAGKCLLTFLDNYDKDMIDMEVFIPENSELAFELTMRNIAYTEVPHMADTSLSFKAVMALLSLFKQKQPQIVHTHAALSARIAAKLYGKCKIVHTRHSVFDQPTYLKVFPLKQLAGLVNATFSHRIIAVSPAARDNLTDIGTNPKQITVVFNGVDQVPTDTAEIKASTRLRYGLAETDFVVAIIARLEAVKGHDYVIDAAKLIAPEDATVKILIAGNGTLEDHLRQRIQEEHVHNVILTGFVKRIREIENVMDLQINASYGTEATSLSLLEGMSLGIPAVVSDFGGNPYVIKQEVNGLVVPKRDADALAKGIMRLKNQSILYQQLRQASFSEFNTHYTAKSMTQNTTDVYLDVLQLNNTN